MNKKAILLTIVFIALFFISADAQCSQCKLISEQNASSDDAILGVDSGSTINSAILYIMAIPYIILFFLFRKRIFRFFKAMKSLG